MIQSTRAIRSPRASLIISIAMPLAVVMVGVGGIAMLMAFKRTPERTDPSGGVPVVSTVAVQPFDGDQEIVVSGLVVPYREIPIASQVEGIVSIKDPACERGNPVLAETVLMTIDQTNYDFAVRELTAEYNQATVSLNELDLDDASLTRQIDKAREKLDIRTNQLDRMQEIEDPGVFAELEIEAAKWDKLLTEIELQNLEDAITMNEAKRDRLQEAEQLALAKLERAELDRDRCIIKAPTNGVIVDDPVEAGSYVMRGSTVVQFQDTSKAEIECNLRIEQLQVILENANQTLGPYELPGNDVVVEFEFEAGEKRIVSWHGRLVRTNGIGLDEMTRTMPCIVEVSQPVSQSAAPGWNSLVQDMYVRIRIKVPTQVPMVRIPARALQGRGVVWVVQDDKMRRVEVRLANESMDSDVAYEGDHSASTDGRDSNDDGTVIVHAVPGLLEAGSQLVVSPVTFETEGQQVSIERTQPQDDNPADGGSDQ